MSAAAHDSPAAKVNGRIELAEDAPEVNLGALILENNHGLEILENHPTMGRVIVATQDLDSSLLYTPILRELPALVCKQMDYVDFMEQFLDAPVELQVGLLDMFYQPLDSIIGKTLVEPAEALFILGAIDDLTVIHQLLSIYVTNSHQYRGTHSAIPLFASKFAHSCAPNMGYSSVASEDGALEYKLLRPVKKGDLVCFSYIADVLETPAYERRQLLMETKSFWCSCDRCNGPDYLRCVPCPTCSDRVPCQYIDQSDQAYWECSKCGMLESDPIVLVERRLGKPLDMIHRSFEHRKGYDLNNSEYSPAVLQDVVSECQTELSETHHMTIKALRLLFTTATARAYVQIKRMIARGLAIATPRIHSLFWTSALAGYRLVLAGECVAAECTGCQVPENGGDMRDRLGLFLQPKHEVQYDRALVVQHICENIMGLPIYWWPPQTLTMTSRYLPILNARFGEKIAPIKARLVEAFKDLTCLECGTYWDAYTAGVTSSLPPKVANATPNKGKPGSTNKKKNNKKKKRRK